jgi:hypothetical protein
MRRTDALLLLVLALAATCAPADRRVSIRVGEVQLLAALPPKWDHVDNGGRHEFHRGDMHMALWDAGIATPDSLASALSSAREPFLAGRTKEGLDRVRSRRDAAIAVLDLNEKRDFWRKWNRVAYDHSRTAELPAALDSLIAHAASMPPVDGASYARWVASRQLDTLRYQIRSVARVPEGELDWWQASTWSTVTHQYPRMVAVSIVRGRLIVLESGLLLEPESQYAFDALLASLAPAPSH